MKSRELPTQPHSGPVTLPNVLQGQPQTVYITSKSYYNSLNPETDAIGAKD